MLTMTVLTCLSCSFCALNTDLMGQIEISCSFTIHAAGKFTQKYKRKPHGDTERKKSEDYQSQQYGHPKSCNSSLRSH